MLNGQPLIDMTSSYLLKFVWHLMHNLCRIYDYRPCWNRFSDICDCTSGMIFSFLRILSKQTPRHKSEAWPSIRRGLWAGPAVDDSTRYYLLRSWRQGRCIVCSEDVTMLLLLSVGSHFVDRISHSLFFISCCWFLLILIDSDTCLFHWMGFD